MVATARLAVGLSGLRNRNTRVTNKTQLHVVKGSIEADPIILDDDDDEKNRILASQGVDEEDANEHHLQAALFASSQRALSTAYFRPETNATTDPDAFIPTPDAAGLVAEYDDLYPSKRYKEPVTHLRFSDSIDESCTGGLTGSFTYFLDERDAEWLAKHNGAAKGEGTSTNGSGSTTNGTNLTTLVLPRDAPRNPHARGSKIKGKEPEHPPSGGTEPSVIIDEGHFELIMGLFEKWTDETVSPYLHLDPSVEHFPDFDNYQKYFSEPLSCSVFANFNIPSTVPNPEKMVQLARVIHPWWKERRMERKGQAIVPQLHVLILEAQEKEDKSGGSPYTCFRKRDVKPMRKTRTNNVTHTEKLTRLRGELQSSLELAQMVVQREKLKHNSANIAVEVWRSRESLAEYMKQLNGAAPGSIPPADELLLLDKERKPRKSKVEGTGSGRIVLLTNRRPSHIRGAFNDSLDPHSPLTLGGDTSHAFEECQKWPTARMTGIQREVERELLKARKDDAFWEDIVDIPYQSIPSPSAEKLYRPCFSAESLTGLLPPVSSGVHTEIMAPSHVSRVPRSLRLRTGRGGRLHLDRRLHVIKPHRLLQREWTGYPPRADDMTAAQLHTERWAARSWRPRDTGVRLGRKERELGEDYWAHRSMFDDVDSTDTRVKNIGGLRSNREAHIPTFGFDQSISGWDSPELWARARANRGEGAWKPTSHLGLDAGGLGREVAAQNEAERERVVEAWRGKTSESLECGGALALFTDGGTMTEPDEPGEKGRGPDGCDDMDTQDDRAADAIDHAWRMDERWRFDSESQDIDDRFLLDDYQPKFLRTTITLLDAQDQESITPDSQCLVPPPSKQNRYLDNQLRLQHLGLPQLSLSETSTSATPRPIPRHITSSLSVSPSPPVPNITSVQSQNNITNPTTNGTIPDGSTTNGTSGLRSGGAVVPVASRPSSVTTSTMRNDTLVRTKQTNGTSLSHPGLSTLLTNGVNSQSETQLNGGFPSSRVKGYPLLKATLDRTISTRQDPDPLPLGRSAYQMSISSMNGVNGSEHATMNMGLGVGNLQLKMSAQRKISLRANGVEENRADTMHTETSPPRQSTDACSITRAQQFSLSHLPTTHTA